MRRSTLSGDWLLVSVRLARFVAIGSPTSASLGLLTH